MKITSNYPGKVFYRFFKPEDTAQWFGLKEGFLNKGESTQWEDHHTTIRVEFKQGSLTGSFIKPANEIYQRDDELTITQNGRVEVHKPYELQLLAGEMLKKESFGIDVQCFDLRQTALDSKVTESVTFSVSSANRTESGTQETKGTTHTIGIEVGVSGNYKGVEASGKANYTLEVKDELVKVFRTEIEKAAAASVTREITLQGGQATVVLANWVATYKVGQASKNGIIFEYKVPHSFELQNLATRDSSQNSIETLNGLLAKSGSTMRL